MRQFDAAVAVAVDLVHVVLFIAVVWLLLFFQFDFRSCRSPLTRAVFVARCHVLQFISISMCCCRCRRHRCCCYCCGHFLSFFLAILLPHKIFSSTYCKHFGSHRIGGQAVVDVLREGHPLVVRVGVVRHATRVLLPPPPSIASRIYCRPRVYTYIIDIHITPFSANDEGKGFGGRLKMWRLKRIFPRFYLFSFKKKKYIYIHTSYIRYFRFNGAL